jgi:hypothetical protein
LLPGRFLIRGIPRQFGKKKAHATPISDTGED